MVVLFFKSLCNKAVVKPKSASNLDTLFGLKNYYSLSQVLGRTESIRLDLQLQLPEFAL